MRPELDGRGSLPRAIAATLLLSLAILLLIGEATADRSDLKRNPRASALKVNVREGWSGSAAIKVTARSSSRIKKIRFFIDGAKSKATIGKKWGRGRVAYLNTERLQPGPHVLKVVVKTKRRRLQSKRSFLVTKVPFSSGKETPGVLFRGLRLRDYSIQAAPGAVEEVPDPLGSGATVFRMTVNDDHVAPLTPTEDPRAQLLSPEIIESGLEFWASTKILLPTDFPDPRSWPRGSWLQLLQIYGPPWKGSPPVSVGVDRSGLVWQRNSTYDWDVPWRMPLVKGRWVDVLLHERFSSDGFVELWIDGQQLTFFNGGEGNYNDLLPTSTLAMATMDRANGSSANSFFLQSYRERGFVGTLTTYHWPLIVGTSRAAIER